MIADERTLINKIAKGDKEALGELFTLIGGKIKAAAFRVLRDSSMCDDVLNEVLIKVWQGAESISRCKNVSAYIYTMAFNLAIDIKRKNKYVCFEAENYLEQSTKNGENNKLEEKIFIDGILENMEESLRIILIYKAVWGMNFYEISKTMGMTYKQARSRYIKASELFKEIYNKLDR